MMGKDEIYNKLKTTLIELFQFEEHRVTLSSRLYEDLEFDSIDVIDLVHRLEDDTEWKIDIIHFKEAKTIEDVVNAVYRLSQEGVATA